MNIETESIYKSYKNAKLEGLGARSSGLIIKGMKSKESVKKRRNFAIKLFTAVIYGFS
jgi:hypothetical protein